MIDGIKLNDFFYSDKKIFLLNLKIISVVFFLVSLICYITVFHPVIRYNYAKNDYIMQKEKFDSEESNRLKPQRETLKAFYISQWISSHDTDVYVIKSISRKKVVDREIGMWVTTDETECEIVSLTKRRCKPVKEWVHLYDTYKTVLDTEYTTPWRSVSERNARMESDVESEVDGVIEQIRFKFHDFDPPKTWFDYTEVKGDYYGWLTRLGKEPAEELPPQTPIA